MNYTGITTQELEARFDALHDEVNAGLDSLPRATWTEEYKAAKRALMLLSTEFHAVGAELAGRFQQNASEFARIKLPEWHCMGCGDEYDGDAELHICLPGGPGRE